MLLKILIILFIAIIFYILGKKRGKIYGITLGRDEMYKELKHGQAQVTWSDNAPPRH